MDWEGGRDGGIRKERREEQWDVKREKKKKVCVCVYVILICKEKYMYRKL